MKRILAGLVAVSLLAGSTAGAFAAERPYAAQQSRYDKDRRGDRSNTRYSNSRYGYRTTVVKYRAPSYRRGERISHVDWDRGRRADYRVYRLPRPARGYEWREVNGHFVEAAIVGGLIATVLIAASR